MTTPPTALIAEDEPLLAAALQADLSALWPDLRVAAAVGDGAAALAQALALRPTLCFLDIRMPGMSGLEAAQALAEDWPDGEPFPLIVFVTAYDQYALQAFEAGGLPFAAEFVNAWRDPSTARELVAVMGSLEREAPGSPFAEESVAAFTYMIAGAIDSVFARFETAYEQRSESFLYRMRHPIYDPLRSDPRYLSLMRRVGLDP